MLLLHDLPDGLTYSAIYVIFDRTFSTRCYVTFSSSTKATSASEAVDSLDVVSSDLKVELLSSRNVAEGDDD